MKKILSLLFILAAVFLTALPVRADGLTSVPVELTYDQAEARKMLSMINDFRTGPDAFYLNPDNTTTTSVPGLGTLTYDYELEAVAMQRAAEIYVRYDHTRPDGTAYKTIVSSHSVRGENICSSDDGGAGSAFEMFREDNKDYDGQSHRRNFLKPIYTSVGIACARDADGSTYWAVELGAPVSSSPAVPAFRGKKTMQVNVPSDDIRGFFVDQDPTTAFWVDQGFTVCVSNLIKPYLAMGGDCENFTPANVTAEGTSSDPRIAYYKNGYIFANGCGEANITITYSYPGFSNHPKVEYRVVVTDPKDQQMPDDLQIMHRLYNPNSGEHFYTANVDEKFHLVQVGWIPEGIGWFAPESSKHPVYRLYNPNAGDHHYTMDPAEKDMLVRLGWNYEGIGWYSDDKKGTPLYRQYNPNAKAGSHNYTTNKEENDMLVSIGWRGEGIGWYGLDYENDAMMGDQKPKRFDRGW